MLFSFAVNGFCVQCSLDERTRRSAGLREEKQKTALLLRFVPHTQQQQQFQCSARADEQEESPTTCPDTRVLARGHTKSETRDARRRRARYDRLRQCWYSAAAAKNISEEARNEEGGPEEEGVAALALERRLHAPPAIQFVSESRRGGFSKASCNYRQGWEGVSMFGQGGDLVVQESCVGGGMALLEGSPQLGQSRVPFVSTVMGRRPEGVGGKGEVIHALMHPFSASRQAHQTGGGRARVIGGKGVTFFFFFVVFSCQP